MKHRIAGKSENVEKIARRGRFRWIRSTSKNERWTQKNTERRVDTIIRAHAIGCKLRAHDRKWIYKVSRTWVDVSCAHRIEYEFIKLRAHEKDVSCAHMIECELIKLHAHDRIWIYEVTRTWELRQWSGRKARDGEGQAKTNVTE